MTSLFHDNFEIYGGDNEFLLQNRYAEVRITGGDFTRIGAYEGRTCLDVQAHSVTTGDPNSGVRLVLPAEKDVLFVAFRLYNVSLPLISTSYPTLRIRDNANNDIIWLRVTTTGQVVIETATQSFSTAGPVIVAGTWQHFEFRFDRIAQTARVRMSNGTSDLLTATGITSYGSQKFAQLLLGKKTAAVVQGNRNGFTDLHVWDTNGTINNDWLGDVRVHTVRPNADVETGWAVNPRQNMGTGIGQFVPDADATLAPAVSTPDTVNFDFANGDYTIEGWFRLQDLPTGTNEVGLIGKWSTGTGGQAWKLVLFGPDANNGHLQLVVSTTGANSIVIHSWPWNPDPDTWYFIAISRNSGVSRLFIDGVQKGPNVADANTYFNDTTRFTVGARPSNVGSAINHFPLATSLNGWVDEIRLTKGVGRYTANFARPTAPFGRDVAADPSFASVVLLLGFDGTLTDDSSFHVVMTAFNGANYILPDDGEAQYQVINTEAIADDAFIAAAYLPASSELTTTGNAANGETVTINGRVYTFKTVLAAADDVLVGATAAASLDNLRFAINKEPGEGTLYGTGTLVNTDVLATWLTNAVMGITALIAGTAGNAITTTETMANAAWTGATMAGGVDIPGPSSFRFERLPRDVTSVRSVSIVARMGKSATGTAKVRQDFVTPAANAHLGTPVVPSVDVSYQTQIFETDPDTGGLMTPLTLVNGRVREVRTE